ncbi:MAG: methylated-DNA--[protein]-cysteine S-methyltransferase [Bacteroidales bacterium]|jgi:AraC family transcriptional regulator of adaptative response/methylated-DNA-[protein]-cysteine methyltransferase|nr:methylated-DNA--[protein]-cysteine S-methyltransferase [Bacteroidales bacterium]
MKQKEQFVYGYCLCQWGKVLGVKSDKGLMKLALVDEEQPIDEPNYSRNDEQIKTIVANLDKPDFNFQTIKLDLRGTDFQCNVWQELLKIPFGQKVCYEDIAKKLNTKAVRAVGSAVKKNPVAFIVPCHRVIRKSGDTGNYFYGRALKEQILLWEKQMAKR